MNLSHPIIQFFLGDQKICEELGFSPASCISATNEWWEGCHNHIQWLFPLREPSNFNPDAPLVTDEVVEAFQNYAILQEQLHRFATRFLNFLAETRENWMHPGNHNMLRVTRAIKCLSMLGAPGESYMFYTHASLWSQKYPDLIPALTKHFWDEAYYGEHVDRFLKLFNSIENG